MLWLKSSNTLLENYTVPQSYELILEDRFMYLVQSEYVKQQCMVILTHLLTVYRAKEHIHDPIGIQDFKKSKKMD